MDTMTDDELQALAQEHLLEFDELMNRGPGRASQQLGYQYDVPEEQTMTLHHFFMAGMRAARLGR